MQTRNCPICKCPFETSHSRQVYCHKCRAFPKTGKVAIYALCQVGNPEIRYIGSTTDPVNRYMNHRIDAHGPEIKKWVESINGNIDMVILEIVDKLNARASEETQMRYYGKLGHKLLNKRAAGKMLSSDEAHDYISNWFRNK